MASWLPLESNPEVLNPFVRQLGLPESWAFCDVFGLDPELLMMVPQPCAALCLLYPSANISGPRRKAFAEVASSQPPPPPSLFFCKQHDNIGNACGTIACIHAVANAAASGNFELVGGSPLQKFVQQLDGKSAADRGQALLEATEMQSISDATAEAGETEGAGTDDAQNQHFIAFVNHGGLLYELDGRNFVGEADAAPICHGQTTAESFLLDATQVVQKEFMARDPSSMNFNLVALAKVDG